MNNDICPICNQDPMKNWPVIDYTTGFKFCDGCYRDVMEHFNKKYQYSNKFSDLLRSIAEIRDNHSNNK